MATLLFFGKLQDMVGTSSESMELPESISTTYDLRVFLDQHYELPETLSANSIRLAINSEIVADPAPVSDGDEIAFLPPVGGG